MLQGMRIHFGSRQTVVIDHGGFNLKVGLAGDATPSVVANAAVRTKRERVIYIAQDIEHCTQTASLSYLRPFDKGYCVNWDLQQTIFDSVFHWKKVMWCICTCR
jgi:actin-related protein 6